MKGVDKNISTWTEEQWQFDNQELHGIHTR